MSSPCPRCRAPVFFAEKVSSLGKNWHRFCLKCERCNKTLSAGSHAEHDGKPYCHKPCYAALFGPKGVNIGGVGSYIYDAPPTTPQSLSPLSPVCTSPSFSRSEHTLRKQVTKASSYVKTFAGETSLCPGCGKAVFFAEKVMSLGRNWHRPCLRCKRCKKTLTAGSHAEMMPFWSILKNSGRKQSSTEPVDGKAERRYKTPKAGPVFLLDHPKPLGIVAMAHEGVPYCHVPCYGYLFGPKGVNIGDVGCYVYSPNADKSEMRHHS